MTMLTAGINITVGHRPLAEQNADMAVYWLLCTDIMADHFVSLIWIFLPLLLQIFLTKFVIFNTCKQRFRLLDNQRIWRRSDSHNNNLILCVKWNILYYKYTYCYRVSCRWYCVILLTIMHIVLVVVTVLVSSTVTTDNVLLENN
jgi:hypothetical protein